MFDSAFDLGYNSYTKLVMAMDEKIIVHPRVTERHPELVEEDVRHAYWNAIRFAPRLDRRSDEYAGVGPDRWGRNVEVIGRFLPTGEFLIFHAYRPATNKILVELGLRR